MKTLKIMWYLLVLYTFFSCQNNKPTEITTSTNPKLVFLSDSNWVEVTDTIPFSITCLDFDKMYDLFKFDIRTQGDYKNLLDTLRSNFKSKGIDCAKYQFPEIDFGTYSLIGMETRTGFCSIKKMLFKNDIEKKLRYILEITITSPEEILLVNRNMLLVPKIPQDYVVEMDTILQWGF